MNETIHLAIPSGRTAVSVIRSPRRTFQVSVSPESGVVFRVPSAASRARVGELLQGKAEWIERALARVNARAQGDPLRMFRDGAVVHLLGMPRLLRCEERDVQWPVFSETADGWRLSVPPAMSGTDREAAARKALVLWMRRSAEQDLPDRVRSCSLRMGLRPPCVMIKTHRRLWGSCNKYRRSVNLNWKIISFPADVIDYVIIHELCHLQVADHSRWFWQAVGEVCPDWKEKRKWLRENAFRMALKT